MLTDTNPGFQPFGFAGGLYDADTDLVRFGLRDYLPLTGQWTARDPAGFQGAQFSLYSYLGNDPVNSMDPLWSGLLEGLASAGTIVGGGILLFVTLPAVTVSGTAIAGIGGAIVAITGALAIVGGTANIALGFLSPGTTAPTSIPGVVAVGGDSPNSQRLAAIADLIFGALLPTQFAGKIGMAVNRSVTAIDTTDKTANSWGLTTGSKPPGCP